MASWWRSRTPAWACFPDDLERANDLLATAPTPDVAALKDGSQVGLWVVAELAKRSGIQVALRPSAYGGLLAIVLLPDRVIASDTNVLTTDVLEVAPGAVRGCRQSVRVCAQVEHGGARHIHVGTPR